MKAVCALLSLFAATALATLDDDFMGVYLETPELYTYAGHAARSYRPELSTRDEKYKPGLPGGFKCPTIAPSATVPTDARFVRPSDVQVVGAIGDSLTAANGVLAWTVPTVLKQYRGLSWSVGGDKDINTVLTLPNILKKYNSKLYGFSLGSSYSQDTKDAYYNVARAGNTAVEVVEQSEKLVQKILADKRQDQWKIITLFIGGNDVCKMCKDRELYSVENYKKNIITAINNIYVALPNTLVNLVAPLDLKNINELPDSYKCKAVHNGLCSCISNASDPDYGHRLSKQYEAQVKAISDEASTRWPQKNFAVLYQPMFTDGELPTVDGKPDDSFFAPDCFHFSQKGHETAAYNLWNNMMRPANERLTGLVYNDRTLICPTEDAPYIQI